MLADSVGLALLVVLDRLDPAERLAFVLHDMFDLPFDEIAGIVGRSEAAARQLASRARRRVRGVDLTAGDTFGQQRRMVDAFLSAVRAGDVPRLVALLDPGFTVRADKVAAPAGVPLSIQGTEAWAKVAVEAARGARFARIALVDGNVGIVVAPKGRLFRVLRFTLAGDKIAGLEILGEPERLRQLDLAVLED